MTAIVTDEQARQFAEQLYEARRTRTPISAFTESCGAEAPSAGTQTIASAPELLPNRPPDYSGTHGANLTRSRRATSRVRQAYRPMFH